MNIDQYILSRLSVNEKNLGNTLKLLSEDATVPFIARYRKEATGNLDEVEIAGIAKLKTEFEEFEKRKISILKSIESQNSLTEELRLRIEAAGTMVQLEDLYLPFKKSRKTKADTARENGLEPLAKIIMAQNATDVFLILKKYINKNIRNEEEALQGAKDIIAEWINENEAVRNKIRRLIDRTALIETKISKTKAEDEAAQKYKQYFDWSERLKRIPSHRLLAILRGEKEGYLKLKIAVDKQEALELIISTFLKTKKSDTAPYIIEAAEESYKRLLFPSLSKEALAVAKEKADNESINVFSENLKQLFLAPPLGEKRILAIDPGFKSGCKIVCLDEQGNLLYNETIYPHPPQKEQVQAMKKVKSLVNAYNIEAISIGNGTASRETEFFVKKIQFDRDVQVFVVSEAGASVYSASSIARKEFLNYDVTVRGAISIGRRLADPLAELVKIEPKAIGVGQYQHDVDQNKLKSELDTVVSSCVNGIGVNLNTASQPLLSYVSGIGSSLAENIVKYRTEKGAIHSRQELLKVPRLGAKAFEQAAAFLRIKNPEHPLDDSAVHPERYALVEKMAKDAKVEIPDLIGNKDLLKKIPLENYCLGDVGLPTLKDIISELQKPGVDPRKSAKVFEFDPRVKTIADLEIGMSLPGIVNNITNFGCFVDIGIKESGLVHISKLAKDFISDVNAVVKLHQHLQVKVLEVDVERKRIQLSLID